MEAYSSIIFYYIVISFTGEAVALWLQWKHILIKFLVSVCLSAACTGYAGAFTGEAVALVRQVLVCV